jgi:hypothetical protein
LEKDIKLTPYSQGNSGEHDGILQDISEFIFGEPAEGAEILKDVLENNRNPAEREYDRVLEEQERERKQNEPNLWERFQNWWDGITNRNDSTEFDLTIIDVFPGDLGISSNVEKFTRADDFLKGDTFIFPDGDFSGLSKPIPDFDDDLSDLLTDVFNSSQPSSIPENFSTGEPLIGPAYPGGDAGSVSEIPPLHNKTFQEVDQI